MGENSRMLERRTARITNDTSVLLDFARSSDVLVRRNLAANPAATREVLEILAVDVEDRVANAATAHAGFTWNQDTSVQAYLRHRPASLASVCDETSLTLAQNWQGSVKTLLEAAELVSRAA